MPLPILLITLLLFGTFSPAQAEETATVPGSVYTDLEYVLSLSQSSASLEPDKVAKVIGFVDSIAAHSGRSLTERQGASGAFYSFSVRSDFGQLLDYVYNPDIPLYVTMPSSLRQQEWLTPEIITPLKQLPRQVKSATDIRLLRGRDREIISPDTNTGGYYTYEQDRMVIVLPGPTGPILLSVSSQNDASQVGKKGCIVGNDKNWNYLYSEETGLNTFGLGWVESYMYSAHSVVVYITDTAKGTIRVGSFKWLNGGWAKMNMVNSNHILEGMKRFATDFQTVLEAPGLPAPQVLEKTYQQLQQKSVQDLRKMVTPYFQALIHSGAAELQTNPFKTLLSSQTYLQQMSSEDLVQVLLLEYVKAWTGREPLVRLASIQ